MIQTAYTFFFQEVFEKYEDWVEFMSDKGIVDYTDATQSAFDQWVFNLLYNHYYCCDIRYSVIDAFKSELLIVYENKFKQFMNQKRLIDLTQNLTADDIAEVNTTITNMANNPNTDNPLNSDGVLPFISAQTFNNVKSNRLKAYLDAINNLPTFKIYKFFKGDKEEMGFDDLFMNIQPHMRYFYERGDNNGNNI